MSLQTLSAPFSISFTALTFPTPLLNILALHILCRYVRLADEFVQIASGPSANNYGNVDLVVKLARGLYADAVWPGWGHASENSRLPAELERHGIAFIGPSKEAMDLVGDKIRANLLAQSCSVPVLPWSGSGVHVEGKHVPSSAIESACISSEEGALAAARSVGYPSVLKASEGGGGKGIRKVQSDAELRTALPQVSAEVPGSPIFLQRLSANSNHVEVQVLADAWGNSISLFGRDCSVQRRHQKIIEEGPVTAAPLETRRELEQGAVRLAKRVGYRNAGTVEYLYNDQSGEISFLEVNPRLQVEHPVTEMITGINIPAVQLQIAMGIPLYRIDQIREFYNEVKGASNPIDFDNVSSKDPLCHCVAGRITAEDPDDGFKPSSGSIRMLEYRQLPGVLAYFSVGCTCSKVHEYADSQFGHIFATASSREVASRLLDQALDGVVVRGEVNTNVKYLQKLVSSRAFLRNEHDTSWLDSLIACKEDVVRPNMLVCVVAAAIAVTERKHVETEQSVLNSLGRGVAPDMHSASLSEHTFDLIYCGYKFQLEVQMRSRWQYHVWMNNSVATSDVLKLPDGALLLMLDGKSHIVTEEHCKVGLKVLIDGFPCYFPEDTDPSRLVATSKGKLLRYLVPNGSRVRQGEPYAEMEVMKTVMQLVATSSGRVEHCITPGTALEPGSVLCTVEVNEEEDAFQPSIYRGTLPPITPRGKDAEDCEQNVYELFKRSKASVKSLLAGYNAVGDPMKDLMDTLRDHQLVVCDFEEQRSCVAAKASAEVMNDLDALSHRFGSCKQHARSLTRADDVALVVGRVAELVERHERTHELAELRDFSSRHSRGLFAFECDVMSELLEQFLDVEAVSASDCIKAHLCETILILSLIRFDLCAYQAYTSCAMLCSALMRRAALKMFCSLSASVTLRT
jgi:acetyl-CoA carboxylase/biotin carboxylase 1